MRAILFVIILATSAYGQSIVENAAAAAGGSVGGVAGKKVGEGIANIFGKVDKAAGKAAKTGTSPTARPRQESSDDALMEVGPGVPKGAPSVPPPPPIRHVPGHKTARVHTPEPAPMPAPAPLAPAPPPAPREATAADLRKITAGMNRDKVRDLAPPSVRITMFEDGHLLEIYRYVAGDNNLGTVRLVDGAVEAVQLQHP